MDGLVIYVIVAALVVLIGAVIAVFIYPGRIRDTRKCINCPHAITCDKGDPDRICHLDEKK